MTGIGSIVLESSAVLCAMLANGVRQRLTESGHGACHHVVIIADPTTGKIHCQGSLQGSALRDVLRDVANGAVRR